MVKNRRNSRNNRWPTVKRCRRSTVVAVFALLFQISIQFGGALSVGALAVESDNNLPPLIICSAASGIVQILGDTDQDTPANSEMPCIFCLVCQAKFLGGSLLTVEQLVLAPPEQTDLTIYQISHAKLNSLEIRNQSLPRAPPSFV